ncbi:MAG: SDR family NAD(P)-dependent oxidoreductase [Treponema sp.]|nr:SDR family NAD(P)-dependent oxidoreductase [Treponema sp.]
MKDITNNLILITGGASGIGRCMAFKFARRGSRVVVWDVNAAALKTLETEAAAEGLSVASNMCDIADRAAVDKQAKALIKEHGPVDILINNAGIVSGKKLLEIRDEDIIQTLNANVLSLFWMTRAFLPSMLERNSGHIVTIASAAGLIGVQGLADYCAGKFAAVGFDESVRMELRRIKSSVKTTVVCPYFIDTGMFEGVKTRFPLLLPILPEEKAAERIVKAVLRNKKRYIMPSFVYTTLIARLFPPGFMDFLADLFGISRAMDTFTGREKPRPAAGPAKVPAEKAASGKRRGRPAGNAKAPAEKAASGGKRGRPAGGAKASAGKAASGKRRGRPAGSGAKAPAEKAASGKRRGRPANPAGGRGRSKT